jgi:hypothetical protein
MAHMHEFDQYRNVNPQNRFMYRQIAIAMSKVKLGSTKMTTCWMPMSQSLLNDLDEDGFYLNFTLLVRKI